MFRRFLFLAFLGSIAALGCKDSSTKSGGPNATGATSGPGTEQSFRVRTETGDTIQGPPPREVTPTKSSKE